MWNVTYRTKKDASYRHLDAGHLPFRFGPLPVIALWVCSSKHSKIRIEQASKEVGLSMWKDFVFGKGR